MYVVGAIEIFVGVLVVVWLCYGVLVVVLWFVGIIVNFVSGFGDYDIVLCDFGLLLGALMFIWFVFVYDRLG